MEKIDITYNKNIQLKTDPISGRLWSKKNNRLYGIIAYFHAPGILSGIWNHFMKPEVSLQLQFYPNSRVAFIHEIKNQKTHGLQYCFLSTGKILWINNYNKGKYIETIYGDFDLEIHYQLNFQRRIFAQNRPGILL